jgi:EmrB/QacA subfamily drug resistance transporter
MPMPDPAPHPHRWALLPVLCLSVFLVVVDNTIVNVALPSFARNLHASDSSLQWIVDAYSLAFAGLLLAGGGIGDRFGRKRVMQIALVCFGSFSAMAAFADSAGSLIVARTLMGASAAFIFPTGLAILTNLFPEQTERAKAIGIWSATTGIAVALGPITGGLLIAHFWAGSIFLVNVPIVIVTVVLGGRYLPESRARTGHRFDVRGLVVGTVGVASLVYAIIEGPTWAWGSPRTIGLLVLAVLLLGLFAALELRTPGPLLDVRVFRVPRFTVGATSISIAFFALFGFIFLITQYFQLVRGYSALSAGVRTLPFAVTAAVATPLGALLALRIGARWVVGAGLACMAGGLVVAATMSVDAPYLGPVVASMVLLSLGLSLTTAPSTEAVMGSLRADQVGAGAAVNNTTRELGGTLGVAVLGSVFASTFAPRVLVGLRSIGVPEGAARIAGVSMANADAVVHHLPAAAQAAAARVSSTAFIDALHAASAVGAVVAALGAVLAVAFLGAATPGPLTDPGAATVQRAGRRDVPVRAVGSPGSLDERPRSPAPTHG